MLQVPTVFLLLQLPLPPPLLLPRPPSLLLRLLPLLATVFCCDCRLRCCCYYSDCSSVSGNRRRRNLSLQTGTTRGSVSSGRHNTGTQDVSYAGWSWTTSCSPGSSSSAAHARRCGWPWTASCGPGSSSAAHARRCYSSCGKCSARRDHRGGVVEMLQARMWSHQSPSKEAMQMQGVATREAGQASIDPK